MSASSISREVAQLEKAKKVERRNSLMKESIYSAGRVVVAPAIEEKPEEPTIVNVVDSGEIKAKPVSDKKFTSKKKSKK